MKKIIVLLCLLVNTFPSFSQPVQTQDMLINPFWDFYSQNSLSSVNAGKGNTGTASVNDISGIMLNPASFEMPEKIQFAASYEYKSTVNWLPWLPANIELKQAHPELLAGIGYKFNDALSLGLVYQNDFGHKLVLGKIVTTNEYGQETGSYTAYERYNTNTFTIPVTFRYKFLKAGVNLSAVYYKGYNNFITSFTGNENLQQDNTSGFWKFIPSLGIIITPAEQFSFGASYSPPYQESIRWNYTSAGENPAPVYFPAKVNAGIEVRLLQKKLIFDFDYRFANTSRSYLLKDRHDINFGVQYALEKNFIIRTGFFTFFDYRTNDKGANFSDPIGNYDQYFLTLGGTYKANGLSVNLSFMTSNIITTPDVASSRLQATLTYDLCSCALENIFK